MARKRLHRKAKHLLGQHKVQRRNQFEPVPPRQATPSVQKQAKPLPEVTLSPENYRVDLENPLAWMYGHRPSGAAPVQAKLTVSAVGDQHEQEADRVAAKVVDHINTPGVQANKGSALQRESMPEEEELQMQPTKDLQQEEALGEEEELQMKPLNGIQREETLEEEEKLQMKPQQPIGAAGGEASTDLESEIDRARDSGQSLAPQLQTKMGQAMGADFSGVRVHADAQADQLNRSIAARAFTTGQDVFFRKGEYQPGSRGGQELIAHELTHVVQQSGQSSAIQRKMAFTSADLKGSLSKKAKLKGFFGKKSTFSKIQKALAAYEGSNNLAEQKTLLDNLLILAQSWLGKHDDDPVKQASLNQMVPAIQQEIVVLDQKIADDKDYLEDLKNNKFKFMTTTGKMGQNLAGVSDEGKQQAQKSGLTDAELTAIRIYTAQDYAYMNPVLANNKGWLDYKIKELVKQGQINLGGRDTLNDKERQQVKEEAIRHSDKAVEGLAKLPDIKKEVYRGVGLTQKEFNDQYQKGKTVTLPSFTSTSLDKKVSKGFAKREAKGGKVGILLVMQVTKGKDIGDLSVFDKEKEVLLPPKSSFKVDSIVDLGKNVFEVNVSQID
jgi:hypothetical protein